MPAETILSQWSHKWRWRPISQAIGYTSFERASVTSSSFCPVRCCQRRPKRVRLSRLMAGAWAVQGLTVNGNWLTCELKLQLLASFPQAALKPGGIQRAKHTSKYVTKSKKCPGNSKDPFCMRVSGPFRPEKQGGSTFRPLTETKLMQNSHRNHRRDMRLP